MDGLDAQKRMLGTSGINRGSSYALGTLLGANAQSSSVIIGKKPEKYRASSGSRPAGNNNFGGGFTGHYDNSLKPHHHLIAGTSTFGGGILSVLNRDTMGRGMIQESRSSNLQNPAMYAVTTAGGQPTSSLNMNMSKSIENQ